MKDRASDLRCKSKRPMGGSSTPISEVTYTRQMPIAGCWTRRMSRDMVVLRPTETEACDPIYADD